MNSPFADKYGRTAQPVSDPDGWDIGGVIVHGTDPDAALSTFNGLAPEDYVPPPPPKPTTIPTLDFIARFTPAEQEAVMNSGVWQIKLFVMMAASAGEIDLSSEQTAKGMAALVGAGIITQTRATEIGTL